MLNYPSKAQRDQARARHLPHTGGFRTAGREEHDLGTLPGADAADEGAARAGTKGEGSAA